MPEHVHLLAFTAISIYGFEEETGIVLDDKEPSPLLQEQTSAAKAASFA